SDGAFAGAVHDGDRTVQQILAGRVLVNVAHVQPTTTVGEGFTPPGLITVQVPNGGRHARDQGPLRVRDQEVLIPAGPDGVPNPNVNQRSSIDVTRENPVLAVPVPLPLRTALQQPG